MITINVNGEERKVPPGLTISGLLRHLEIHERLVVVERNHEILRHPEYASTPIHEGDSLELVHFVGGG